jgi:hypothetical protein
MSDWVVYDIDSFEIVCVILSNMFISLLLFVMLMCWFMCCISEAWVLTTVVILIPIYSGVQLPYHLQQTRLPPSPPHENYVSGSFSCSQLPNLDQILTEFGTVLPLNPFKVCLILLCSLCLGLESGPFLLGFQTKIYSTLLISAVLVNCLLHILFRGRIILTYLLNYTIMKLFFCIFFTITVLLSSESECFEINGTRYSLYSSDLMFITALNILNIYL